MKFKKINKLWVFPISISMAIDTLILNNNSSLIDSMALIVIADSFILGLSALFDGIDFQGEEE